MRRILLLLAGAAILALPAAATARAQSHHATPDFLVVRNASTDGGVSGSPVATVVVKGFVLGKIAQEGAVQIYHVASSAGSLAAQVAGVDVSAARCHVARHRRGRSSAGATSGSAPSAASGASSSYGAGVSLYAGGVHSASLHGSRFSPGADGTYSFDGARFASLPAGIVTLKLGPK